MLQVDILVVGRYAVGKWVSGVRGAKVNGAWSRNGFL